MTNPIYKYPKTLHLPFSPGLQNDDRVISSLDSFIGEEIVITEKMDGENTTMYPDYIHARSPNGLTPHPSRNRVKELHERIKRDIPDQWRITGENMFAQHSIPYDNLQGYFLVFGIWSGDVCFSWDDTKAFSSLLDLPTVPELFRGLYSTSTCEQLSRSLDFSKVEGFVVRVTRAFTIDEFQKVVAKYVRKGHIQTDSHWLYSKVIPNRLNHEKMVPIKS